MSGAVVTSFDKRTALAFIVAFGIVSLFADMAYEGMRSISGPYLGTLGADGTVVGVVAGIGELFGYLLRLGSGQLASRTRAYWPIALAGYTLQMAVIPLLAFAGTWWAAAIFIVIERSGKALRNPAANTMMSRAGEQIGHGWAFGLHEALDQTGALAGPLIASWVLALHHEYRAAFLWLGVPGLLTVMSVVAVRMRFPYAGRIAAPVVQDAKDGRLPTAFWLYATASACVAFGFADFSLIAFHFAQTHVVAEAAVPLFYAAAMAASGAGALLFGHWFDRRGLIVLVPAMIASAGIAPLVFLGGFGLALCGSLLWGFAQGVHDAIMNAGIARMVPAHARAHAYGMFTAIYGVAWFLGSAVMGVLYDVSLLGLVAVAATANVVATLPLIQALKNLKAGN